MPITKSAIKAAKQAKVRQDRLLPYKTQMRTMMRKLRDAVKDGKKADAEKLLAAVYKSIDTAAKKGIIKPNNADNKKSSMARALATLAKK